MTQVVYALLKQDTALTVFKEASQEALSTNPTVRGIIDNDLGHVCLAKARPDSAEEERVIRLETLDPERALKVLPALPGIQRVGQNLRTLVA